MTFFLKKKIKKKNKKKYLIQVYKIAEKMLMRWPAEPRSILPRYVSSEKQK